MFISIDGTNAVGKSTIIQQACDKLASLGYKIYRTKTPSSSKIGNFMREVLNTSGGYSVCLINAADRYELYQTTILPKLKQNYIVICDRFSFSPYLYNTLDNISFDYTKSVYSNLPMPDHTIILNLKDSQLIIDRINERKKLYNASTFNDKIDRYEFNIEKELRVFDKCLKYFQNNFKNTHIVEISQDLNNNVNKIVDLLKNLFKQEKI